VLAVDDLGLQFSKFVHVLYFHHLRHLSVLSVPTGNPLHVFIDLSFKMFLITCWIFAVIEVFVSSVLNLHKVGPMLGLLALILNLLLLNFLVLYKAQLMAHVIHLSLKFEVLKKLILAREVNAYLASIRIERPLELPSDVFWIYETVILVKVVVHIWNWNLKVHSLLEPIAKVLTSLIHYQRFLDICSL